MFPLFTNSNYVIVPMGMILNDILVVDVCTKIKVTHDNN